MTRRTARFKVIGQLDSAGAPVRGIVLVERETGLFIVRRARARRAFTVPLAKVADMVVQSILRGEQAARRAEKLKAKREKQQAAQRRAAITRAARRAHA